MRSPHRENDTVLADDAAPAERLKADVPAATRTCVAVAGAHTCTVERDLAPIGGRLAQHQSGTGGSIDLVAVMHLDDLDVEVGIKCFGNPPGDRHQQINAQAHVARLDDGGMAGRCGNGRLVLGAKPGGADDVDDACIGGQTGKLDRRIGTSESRMASTLVHTSSGSSEIAAPTSPIPATAPTS